MKKKFLFVLRIQINIQKQMLIDFPSLGFRVDKEDEICCLIKGCNFLLKNIPCEAFQFERNADPEYNFQKASPNIFPYLLVNIGSGVSILKVSLFTFFIGLF